MNHVNESPGTSMIAGHCHLSVTELTFVQISCLALQCVWPANTRTSVNGGNSNAEVAWADLPFERWLCLLAQKVAFFHQNDRLILSMCRAPCGVLKKREDRPLAWHLVQKQHTRQKRLSYQLTLSKCPLNSKLKSNDCLLLVSAWKFIQITEELVQFMKTIY